MKDTLANMIGDLATVIEGGMVIDEETGEILFDAENLEALQADTAQKFLAVEIYKTEQRAKAANLKELAKKLTDSARFLERKADRMDDYMLRCAKAAGGEIKTDTITVKVRKCPPSVEIIEEAQIPDAYWTEKVTRSVNKTLIKNTIKGGGFVPGAALVANEKVEVK